VRTAAPSDSGWERRQIALAVGSIGALAVVAVNAASGMWSPPPRAPAGAIIVILELLGAPAFVTAFVAELLSWRWARNGPRLTTSIVAAGCLTALAVSASWSHLMLPHLLRPPEPGSPDARFLGRDWLAFYLVLTLGITGVIWACAFGGAAVGAHMAQAICRGGVPAPRPADEASRAAAKAARQREALRRIGKLPLEPNGTSSLEAAARDQREGKEPPLKWDQA
jgi:hypothetical protein